MADSSPALERAIAESHAAGEGVVLATALSGPFAGQRLLIWSAGQVLGDLGWPRLNQRVALFGEQVFAGAPPLVTKKFDSPEGAIEVRVELLAAS